MTTPFRLDAPLPQSSLVIEASAGTGKTYSLAALATRLIAERRIRASELLVVTFTRAATAELRDRLRTRIADAAHLLAGLEPTDPAPDIDDPVHAHLASLPDRARIVADLERAVTEFDAATISTIHGFAAQILGLLGLTDTDEGGLADDNDELTLAVCADVLAAAAADGTPGEHLPKFKHLADNVQLLLQRPGLSLAPDPDPMICGPDHVERAEVMRNLIDRCLLAIRDQRRRSGRRSFGDILTLLRDELRSERAETAAELVRTRYRAALIDEFQDTDPIQWDIFRILFDGRDGTDLILVGDPKQAIYAFRGADVHTYLRAVENRPDTRSLTVNWRSDGAALTAVDALFDGVTFGSDSIAFSTVRPAEKHISRRLRRTDGSARPGLQIRHRTTSGVKTSTRVCGEPSIAAAAGRSEVYRDLANTIIDLLEDTRVPRDDGETDELRPGDIAVLVPSTAHAENARQVLLDHGIPAVLARGRSVLESPAARHWRWLLEAVARPADHRRARAFALSWFGGHDPTSLDAATDEDIARIQDQLWTWAGTLNDAGLEAFLRRVVHDSGVVPRVLETADGDRDVTDLEHIAELLRTERPRDRAGTAGLLAVLKEQQVGGVATNPNADYEGDPSSRRVASEVDAVQIMTVWVAKGLEFPVVCCPTLWCGPSNTAPIIHPDGDERVLDVLKDAKWPDVASHEHRKSRSNAERDGEALRLLYVALTRARHQTVLWWARGKDSHKTALGRVLFGRDEDGTVDPEILAPDGGIAPAAAIPPEADSAAHLGRLAARADERSGLEEPVMEILTLDSVESGRRLSPRSETADAPELSLARLGHIPPRLAARWSFSRISARAGDLHDNIDEPAAPGAEDPHRSAPLAANATATEPATDPAEPVCPVDPVELAGLDAPGISPFAPLPASAAFGLLVHAIYEHVDFTDEQLEVSIADRLGRELGHRGIDLTPQLPIDATAAEGRRRVVDGVAASLRTPLGDDLHGLRLADVGRRDRLDELDFELHLPHPGRPITDRQLGAVLLAHLDPDDPFRPWAKRVADGIFDVDLAGHLTGSIDLVLRVRGADPETPDRYLVCDYKTNRLHDPSGPPRPDDYGPGRLVEEMSHAHYPLQALLYSVALHRHLRGRLPDYDPSRHLGGVRYLFVRGMAGPATPTTDGRPHGVCRWDPAPAAVTAVSDLLAGVAVHELCATEARP